MFKTYREGFRKAIEEHEEQWQSFKWYEKAGVYICGPIAYGIGSVVGFIEGIKEYAKQMKKA